MAVSICFAPFVDSLICFACLATVYAFDKASDCWRDDTLASKGWYSAWAVHVDLAGNDVVGFGSPSELCSIICFPEGYY